MKKFVSTYTSVPSKAEYNSGHSMTESAGYIPAKVRIEQLIQAGIRLQEWRAEQFDFASGEEVDEEFEDPTRSKNFDLSDAHQLKVQVQERQAARRAAAAQEKKVSGKPDDKKAENVQEKGTE